MLTARILITATFLISLQTTTSTASFSGSLSVPAPMHIGHLQSSSSTQEWIKANPGPSAGISAGLFLVTGLICWVIKKCRRRILNHYRNRRRRHQVFPESTSTRTSSNTSVTPLSTHSRSISSSSSSPSLPSRPLSTTVHNVEIPMLNLKPVLELSRTLTAVKEEPTKITTQDQKDSLRTSIVLSTKSPLHSPDKTAEERDILAEAAIIQQQTARTVEVASPHTPPYALTAPQSTGAYPLTGQVSSGNLIV